jgi:hypothetical protein
MLPESNFSVKYPGEIGLIVLVRGVLNRVSKGLILQFYSIKIYLEVHRLREVVYVPYLVFGNWGR